MLTRLEVDNFKNLLDFSIDFGPFTCIAGENGVGKSNIFDAIHFLSLLADHSILEAALRIRGEGSESSEVTTNDLSDIFWGRGADQNQEIRLAAEMIVDRDSIDDFGRKAIATATYLRYEVRLKFTPPTGPGDMGRLTLASE